MSDLQTARPRIRKPVYLFSKVVLFVSFKLWFGIRVRNAHVVPRTGGVLIAPSHRSYLDIPTLGVGLPRSPTFMAQRRLFRTRLSAAFFRMYGSFPVTMAKPDREALKTCIDMLKAGDAVTVFPEGKIASGSRIEEVFSGVAYIAFKAGTPIVPVGLAGTEQAMGKGKCWPRPKRIAVHFGEPIDPGIYAHLDRREATEKLTADLHSRLQDAFDLANELRGAK